MKVLLGLFREIERRFWKWVNSHIELVKTADLPAVAASSFWAIRALGSTFSCQKTAEELSQWRTTADGVHQWSDGQAFYASFRPWKDSTGRIYFEMQGGAPGIGISLNDSGIGGRAMGVGSLNGKFYLRDETYGGQVFLFPIQEYPSGRAMLEVLAQQNGPGAGISLNDTTSQDGVRITICSINGNLVIRNETEGRDLLILE